MRNALEWAAIVLGAFAVALIIKTFLIQAFYIPSPSMFPTLREDDRVLVNKLSYDLHDVNRGDLVVFERPPGETDTEIKDLIKRVIALPGDVISECGDGRVCIDGTPLDEPYVPDGMVTTNITRQTVPEGDVFVMGDNRENSRDSRVFGPIDQDTIVGRAFVRIWPLTDLGLL